MHIVADPLIEDAAAAFADFGDLHLVPGRAITRANLIAADALLVRSVTRIDAGLLAGTPVRFVGSATAGTDHIDLDFLRRAGIAFAHAPGANADAVAEYVLCAVLNLCVRDGIGVHGLTAGVIGYGHTGAAVVRKLAAIGIECRVNDPPRASVFTDRPYVELEAALAADIVTVHTPLTDGGTFPTHDLLHADRIAQLRSRTILINAARGGIVTETAVRERLLRDADLRFVADCWAGEPAIDPDLLRVAALATPHIAGHTVEAKRRGTAMIRAAFCRHFGLIPAADWIASGDPGVLLPLVSESNGGEQLLDACCRHCYDIEADSARLKEGLGGEPAAIAQHFDRCRQDRARHEFGFYRISPRVPMAPLLARLGFRPG